MLLSELIREMGKPVYIYGSFSWENVENPYFAFQAWLPLSEYNKSIFFCVVECFYWLEVKIIVKV